MKIISVKKLKNIFKFKNIFWFYFLVMGFIFVFLVPPMRKHDEQIHYKRVVSISKGQIFCKKNNSFLIPDKYINMADNLAIGQRIPKKHYIYNFVNFGNDKLETFDGCGLFFLGYLPNTLGFMLGNLIYDQNPFIGFYLSRLFGLIFFLLLFLLSKKNIKDRVIKTILIVVCCIPMLINQVSAIGYDGVLISSSIFLFTWIIKILEKKEKLFLIEKIIFLTLIIVVISIKPVAYFPFVFLYFLIPYRKINPSIKKYLLLSFCFFSFIGIYYLIYLKFGILSGLKADLNSIEFYNKHFQRLLIRRDPLFFLKVFFDSIKINSLGYFDSMIAQYYFGTTVITRCLFGFVFGGLFVYVTLNSGKCKFKFNKLSLFSLFGIVFGVFFLISFTLYSEFSGLSSNTISGVQGRYFLPILVYLFLFFYLIGKNINLKKTIYFIFFITLMVILLETIVTINKGVLQREKFIKEKIISDFKIEIGLIKDNKIEFNSILNKNNIIFNVKGEIFGLIVYHNNDNHIYKVPQKWKIKDSNCDKVLRSGYLQIDKLKEDKIYEITFRKIKTKEESLCLSIEPLEIFENENYFRIGYIDNKPLIYPLLLPDYRIEINDYGLSYNNNLNIGEINEDTEFKQTFIANNNNLTGIELFLATYMERPNVSYDFVLMDESCTNEVRRVSIDVSNSEDLNYYEIYFEPIFESINKGYCFTLETEEKYNNKSKPITIEMSKTDIYNDGDLFLNSDKKDEDLMFRTLYRIEN